MSLVLLVLNFGSLVALVWLIVLGDWRTIVIGILFLVVSNLVLGLLSVPQLIIGAFLLAGDESRAKGFKIFVASLLNAITAVAYGSLAAWLLYRPKEIGSPIPYALLCFTVATSLFGQKETENNPYSVIPMIANFDWRPNRYGSIDVYLPCYEGCLPHICGFHRDGSNSKRHRSVTEVGQREP